MEWSSHEPRPGHYDFSGNNDLVAFLTTAQELGFDVMADPVVKSVEDDDEEDDEDEDDDDGDDVSRVIEDIRGVVRRPPGRFEAIPDDMNPSEILEQVSF